MESVEDEVMRKDERLANRTRTKRERETRIVGAAVNILYITNELGSHSLRRSIPVFFLGGGEMTGCVIFLQLFIQHQPHQLINPSSMDYYS